MFASGVGLGLGLGLGLGFGPGSSSVGDSVGKFQEGYWFGK
jgi:hypothetical protein